MGASAFLKSVDFTAFAVNVKTIAPTQKLYQSGHAIWWYDLPMPMWTLLESYDFSDKTVIPFFSHEGSSNGANALPTITELAGNATVQSDDALSIRGGNVADSEEDVRAWVRELEYGE